VARQVVSDEVLLALWDEHLSYKGVARAADLDRNTVRRRLQKLHIVAPLPPPKGFHVTQLTQDGAGTPTSIQSKPDSDGPLQAILDALPEGFEVDRLSSYVSNGQVTGQWIKAKRSLVTSQELTTAFIEQLASHVPAEPKGPLLHFPAPRRDLMNAFIWGDPHIGLLAHARETGANFDLKIAVRELEASAVALVRKMPIAGTALFLETGDLWHAENDKQVTPRGGNKLDVDGRKSKILESGLNCTQNMIDLLLERHEKVAIAIVPGNHDPDQSIHTRLWLQAIYRNEPRIEILDNADPYMYWTFGDNFFMFTHGDKRVKPQELGEIMLADRPLDVGRCRHRRAFTGHVHHKNVQEFRTFRWESFNSLCASDFWHHSEGYRSERLVEGITFHAKYGEEGRARVTHQELLDH
jgi:hypothetical protein